jgi:arginine/lysine/ornithine decarboxylase
MQKETKDEVKETNKRGQKRRNKEAVMKENDVKSEAVHKRTNERRIKEEKGRKDVT